MALWEMMDGGNTWEKLLVGLLCNGFMLRVERTQVAAKMLLGDAYPVALDINQSSFSVPLFPFARVLFLKILI